MKIYEVSTISLIDLTRLRWYVEAETVEDATNKGYELAHDCSIADEGAISAKIYNGDNDIELNRLYEEYYD